MLLLLCDIQESLGILQAPLRVGQPALSDRDGVVILHQSCNNSARCQIRLGFRHYFGRYRTPVFGSARPGKILVNHPVAVINMRPGVGYENSGWSAIRLRVDELVEILDPW